MIVYICFVLRRRSMGIASRSIHIFSRRILRRRHADRHSIFLRSIKKKFLRFLAPMSHHTWDHGSLTDMFLTSFRRYFFFGQDIRFLRGKSWIMKSSTVLRAHPRVRRSEKRFNQFWMENDLLHCFRVKYTGKCWTIFFLEDSIVQNKIVFYTFLI